MSMPSERYVPDNMAYVFEQQTPETARRILDLVEQAGYDRSVVLTGDSGFYVPADVVDKIYPPEPTEEGTP